MLFRKKLLKFLTDTTSTIQPREFFITDPEQMERIYQLMDAKNENLSNVAVYRLEKAVGELIPETLELGTKWSMYGHGAKYIKITEQVEE